MLKNKNLIITFICTIILIIGIIYAIVNQNYKDTEYNFEEIEQNTIQETNAVNNESIEQKEKIIIHIAGEVNCPGIITIEEGSRIMDAIEEAGGLTENADLSNVNLAFELQDAQKIYIPSIYDEEKSIIQDNGEDVLSYNLNKSEKININKATEIELQALSGIGASTAKKIIEYRSENGNFKNIEDIKNVPGIGESKFNNIKDNICVK